MKINRLASPANPSGAARHRVSVPLNSVGNPCSASIRSASRRRASALCLSLAALCSSAHALNLAWNPNPETNITGYQLSYGTSPGVRSTVIEVGAKTTAAVTGLKQGSTYYFAVTATNSAGLQGAPSAEISYQVPANQIPVAAAKSVSTPEDSSVSVILSAADADGTALTYSVVAGPSKGKLSGTAPNLMYAPNADYNGADSFTFKANDGSAD